MSDFLQKNLEEKSSRQSNLALLRSQWDFDKKLIPKALQAVGQLFPHYSRHDHSHSDQILINIERLLGDRIRLLSATDTWLLLEAAYWHDIGMVVPHEAFEDALNSAEFQIYRKEIAADKSNDLSKFAEKFIGNDPAVVFSGAESPLDAVVKFRLLMAEWFRRHHPSRSESAVNDPWKELGISSPRTELIPKRLFGILGKVCALHGSTFDDVISQLPYKECGMANDDCHPRYVACLLRLGDLLDMDDNRFCPVMQRMAGNDRPASSKAHEDKHGSMRHFRLDTHRIEVEAECETVDGYLEQWKWLDWLKCEMQNQMARWQDIVPSPKLGLLPTLGRIQVSIAGRHLITKEGQRPEFRLNTPRVMNLLKGENLYKRGDTVREILQNAVDASLLRVWLEKIYIKKSVEEVDFDFFDKIFDEQDINVSMTRIESDEAAGRGNILWELSVVDSGVGISRDDLTAMLNVGGSNTNIRKKIAIDAMPEWMRPSGTFGIGLQSIFMWTEYVHIWTKSLYSNECLYITLNSPTGPKRGLATIELDENDILRPAGTKLTFQFETDAKAYGYSYQSDGKTFVSRVMEKYDPLLDSEFPLRAVAILDSIYEFSIYSPIKVNWTYKNINEFISSNEFECSSESFNNDFFSETNCRFRVKLYPFSKYRSDCKIFYRGQQVQDAKPEDYLFWDYELDLYAGDASEWLTFDRNSIIAEARDSIEKIIAKTLRLWIERNRSIFSEEDCRVVSAIAKIWSKNPDIDFDDKAFWISLAFDMPDNWMDMSCEFIEGDVQLSLTYREILNRTNVVLARKEVSIKSEYNFSGIADVDPSELGFCIEEWKKKPEHGIRYVIGEEIHGSTVSQQVFPMLIDIQPGSVRLQVEVPVLAVAIMQLANNIGKGRMLIPLDVFPVEIEADKLILNDEVLVPPRYVFKHTFYPTKHIILPFEIKNNFYKNSSVITLSRFDEFLVWVCENLAVKIDRDQVKGIYSKVIDYIDNDVMKFSSIWRKRRNIDESD